MKQLSKAELLRQLNKVDVLEVITELVQRGKPDTHRQAQISAFTKNVKEQVAEDRDVLLISIMIK
jgi:uncharacterized tellurite resistance protein B-like protein